MTATTPPGAITTSRHRDMWRVGIVTTGIAVLAAAVGGILTAVNVAPWARTPEFAWTSLGIVLLLLAGPILLSGIGQLVWARWGRTNKVADVTACVLIAFCSWAALLGELAFIVNISLANAKFDF